MAKIRESADVTKQKIIKAARSLFAKRGIEGVGIREIADDIGINHAMIIRYFGSKANLAEVVLQNELKKYYELIDINTNQSDEQIGSLLREKMLYSISESDPQTTIRFITRLEMDGSNLELVIPEKSEHHFNQLTALLGSQQKVSADKARQLAIIISAVIGSLVNQPKWLSFAAGMSPDEIDQQKEQIIDLLLNMVKN